MSTSNLSMSEEENPDNSLHDPLVSVKIEPDLFLEIETPKINVSECEMWKPVKIKKLIRRRRQRREDEEIKCPLCDYKTNVKDNYQKHVLRVHKRQEMKCDGCKKSYHLIYLLNEHRRAKHDFWHEYVFDETLKVEKSEGSNIENNDEEIKCPLCEYKTNVKGNYQKHSLRAHNRQQLKCDGCEKSFHLIYLLEEHRIAEHLFCHEYVVDEALKVKISETNESESEDSTIEKPKKRRRLILDAEIKCPLCDYETNDKSNYQKHVLRVHKRQKMKCDGCEKSFHLIYVMDEHRKTTHGFSHEYLVDEASPWHTET